MEERKSHHGLYVVDRVYDQSTYHVDQDRHDKEEEDYHQEKGDGNDSYYVYNREVIYKDKEGGIFYKINFL